MSPLRWQDVKEKAINTFLQKRMFLCLNEYDNKNMTFISEKMMAVSSLDLKFACIDVIACHIVYILDTKLKQMQGSCKKFYFHECDNVQFSLNLF